MLLAMVEKFRQLDLFAPPQARSKRVKCPNCGGTGTVAFWARPGVDVVGGKQIPCEVCAGAGRISASSLGSRTAPEPGELSDSSKHCNPRKIAAPSAVSGVRRQVHPMGADGRSSPSSRTTCEPGSRRVR